MSNSNTNEPGYFFTGVHDLSTTRYVPAPVVSPQHYPLFFIRSPDGDDQALIDLPTYNDAVFALGADALDERKPYFNHQTKALIKCLQSGNACYVRRITTTGAPTQANPLGIPLKKATAVVLATIDTSSVIYEYRRDVHGNVMYDLTTNTPLYALDPVTSARIPVAGGVLVKYSVVPMGNMTMQELQGELSTPGSTEITYPLFMTEYAHNGVNGNNFGWKIWAATQTAPYAGNDSVVQDQQAIIYNAQILENTGSSTPNVVPSLFGDSLTRFMFQPNSYDKYTNQDLTIQNLTHLWADDGIGNNTVPVLSPINKVTVFEENLTTFLGVLLAADTAANPSAPTSMWMLDFLTASYESGQAAFGFQIDTTGDVISSTNSFFMSGGTDGSLLTSDYEAEIINFTVHNPDTEACPAKNILLYPFSYIYDTGFGNSVKDTLPMWMGYRENTSVHLSTYIDGQPALSQAEEIAASSVLQQTLLNQAESVIFATPAFRGTVTLQSGLLSDNYRKEVPAIFELMIKRCTYMGAGNGIMSINDADDYTVWANNMIKYFKTLSSPNYTKLSAKEAWNNGAIYSVPCGKGQQYFYPDVHTIYPNDTSILTSDVVRHIIGHIAWIQANVWKMMTGRDDIPTNALWIKTSNDIFNSLSAGLFAGRVTATPTTFFTGQDTFNGYSWTQSVQVASAVNKDVATFTVVSVRQG
jgi:hypothetical protein